MMTTDHRLVSTCAAKAGKIRLEARLWCDLTSTPLEKTVDHVVVENGTLPADDVYFELKKDAMNLGMTDIDALADLHPQTINLNEDGKSSSCSALVTLSPVVTCTRLCLRLGVCVWSSDLHEALPWIIL